MNEHGIIALEAYNIRELGLSDQVPEGVMKILDNARKNQPSVITYAPEWTKVLEETGTHSLGTSSLSIRNGCAVRAIPLSEVTFL